MCLQLEGYLSCVFRLLGGDATHMGYLQQQAVDAERKTLTYIRRFNKAQVWSNRLISLNHGTVSTVHIWYYVRM